MITHKQEIDAISNIDSNVDLRDNALCLGYTFDDSFKKYTTLDTSNMSEWTKHIDKLYTITLKPISKSDSLLIGFIVYDDFLKKYTVAFAKDSFLKRKIFSLSNSGVNFSPEWIIKDILQYRLKKTGKIESCIDDDYFGKGSIGSSMFIDEVDIGGMTVCDFRTLRDICIDELKSRSMVTIIDKHIKCFEVAARDKEDRS